jgi:TubC N-terminal docking domain
MTPSPLNALLADLSERGIELQAHGDRLRFRPQSAATPALVERLKLFKAPLLAILQGAVAPAAEADMMIRQARADGDADLAGALAEAWEERLSICTTDGGLTLAEAEVVALGQLQTILDSSRSTGYTHPHGEEA